MAADRSSWDEAVARLEEVLASQPFDRALPPLDELLGAARMERDVLEGDERAQKILDEAVLARPLSTMAAIAEIRTEVDVLALEIGMLHAHLETATLTDAELERAGERLAAIRELLEAAADDL